MKVWQPRPRQFLRDKRSHLRAGAVAQMNRTQRPVNHGGKGQCTFMYAVRGGGAMKSHIPDKHIAVLGFSAAEFHVKFTHVKHGPNVENRMCCSPSSLIITLRSLAHTQTLTSALGLLMLFANIINAIFWRIYFASDAAAFVSTSEA